MCHRWVDFTSGRKMSGSSYSITKDPPPSPEQPRKWVLQLGRFRAGRNLTDCMDISSSPHWYGTYLSTHIKHAFQLLSGQTLTWMTGAHPVLGLKLLEQRPSPASLSHWATMPLAAALINWIDICAPPSLPAGYGDHKLCPSYITTNFAMNPCPNFHLPFFLVGE